MRAPLPIVIVAALAACAAALSGDQPNQWISSPPDELGSYAQSSELGSFFAFGGAIHIAAKGRQRPDGTYVRSVAKRPLIHFRAFFLTVLACWPCCTLLIR